MERTSKNPKTKNDTRLRFFVEFENAQEYEDYLRYENAQKSMLKKKGLRLKIFQAGMKQIIKSKKEV